MQHIKNLSCITSRTILSRPDTWKSRFLGYLKVSSRDGIQVDFKLINVDRRVSLCKDLNIVIIENRKIWTRLMSTVAPAPRALIRPGFTFTFTLLFRFLGFVDSAHNSINLSTLGDQGTDLIFVTIITNYIRGEKIVMWKNFSFACMTIVGKLKISPHVEKFQMSPHDICGEIWNSPHMACMWCRNCRHIWKIYAILL